jgi:hypothetical protein
MGADRLAGGPDEWVRAALVMLTEIQAPQIVDRAITLLRRACREVQAGQPPPAAWPSHLGAALQVRFSYTGELVDLDEAVRLVTAAVAGTAADACSSSWVMIMARHTAASVLAICWPGPAGWRRAEHLAAARDLHGKVGNQSRDVVVSQQLAEVLVPMHRCAEAITVLRRCAALLEAAGDGRVHEVRGRLDGLDVSCGRTAVPQHPQ